MTHPEPDYQQADGGGRQPSERVDWRSLQNAARPQREQLAQREFPPGADHWPEAASRRDFLKLMSASLALAGMQGCERPAEKILPYVDMAEYVVPGKPLFFATALNLTGSGVGVVVESHAGRPTKIEGNPLHPGSLGGTDALAQASILSLYDPDRSQAIARRAGLASRQAFLSELQQALNEQRTKGGSGLRLLFESVVSPTLEHQLERFQQEYPNAVWHQYSAVVPDEITAGSRMAFGTDVQTVYHFDRADVILALDADFLNSTSWPIPYARQFSQRRKLVGDARQPEMTRLYVAESTPSLTGAKADHRLTLHPRHISALLHHVARRLGVDVEGNLDLPPDIPEGWIDSVAHDLQQYRLGGDPGRSLVVAGPYLPAGVHALAHAVNTHLDNAGGTVTYHQPVQSRPEIHRDSLRDLVAAIRGGEVDILVVFGGNPAFTSPSDLEMGNAIQQVPFSVHHGLYRNETARLCRWHVPATHPLESWSDVRAYEGTTSIVQPLIAPLFGGWSAHELLASMYGETPSSNYDLIRSHWQERVDNADEFEPQWEDWLKRGTIPGTQAVRVEVQLQTDGVRQAWSAVIAASGRRTNAVDALFRPDPTIWDGEYANNGWLQELPKPFTKLTWDNAALLSPASAKQHSLSNGDMIRISGAAPEAAGNSVEIPVFILPGQPDDCVTLHFGYGCRAGGTVGSQTGFNVYPLRSSDKLWLREVTWQKTGESYPLATTQDHHLMEGRHPVEHGSLEQLRANPDHPEFMHSLHGEAGSLLGEWEYDSYKWGMAIDLTACTGCSACVVACQAENNIPIVGKQQVRMGREMHWLRIDHYYDGAPEHPRSYHQPVACQHCEKAPCEVVCPVAATSHSDEGINEMTYNRCVGTRYCSNNCPYKVRRFNFLQYTDYETPILALLRNPNVTVRSRGVMEKCTYCIQRINAARIESDRENRRIRADEIETACQAACPVQAIAFGDLNNSESQVVHWKESPLNYELLGDTNVAPRTTYLAAIQNPNPELKIPAEE